MKPGPRILILAIGILFAATSAFPAEKKKKKREAKPVVADTEAVNAIKPFDKDGNFEIGFNELTAVQAAFKASPTGNLKQFDKGGDGVLDETVDRAAMNIKLGEAKMAANTTSTQPRKKKKAK
jgi:hypothetical protein